MTPRMNLVMLLYIGSTPLKEKQHKATEMEYTVAVFCLSLVNTAIYLKHREGENGKVKSQQIVLYLQMN